MAAIFCPPVTLGPGGLQADSGVKNPADNGEILMGGPWIIAWDRCAPPITRPHSRRVCTTFDRSNWSRRKLKKTPWTLFSPNGAICAAWHAPHMSGMLEYVGNGWIK